MQVLFYNNFSKRKNSTKRPASSLTPITLDCKLKEETSLLKPTLIISGNHFDYTYAYIPDWHRYYFVENITSENNGLVQIELDEDCLASYKTQLANLRATIAYSSTGWNKDLVDNRVPQVTTKQIDVVKYTPSIMCDPEDNTGGCWVLATASPAGGGASGFLSYWLMSSRNMGYLLSELYNLDIQGWTAAELYSPLDCIVSCYWFPFDFTYIADNHCSATLEQVMIGSWAPQGMVAPKVIYPNIALSLTPVLAGSAIPRYTDYRAIEPFTSYQMFIPLHGLIDLDATDLRYTIESGNLLLTWTVDLYTGDATLGVIGKGGVPLALQQIYSYRTALETPIAGSRLTSMSEFIGATGNLINSSINLMQSQNALQTIGSAVGTLAAAGNLSMQSAKHGISTNGSQGSRALFRYGLDFLIIQTTIDTLDPDDANFIAQNGRPCGYADTIGNHSGYIQCESASVDINALDDERNKIHEYLIGGFYNE